MKNKKYLTLLVIILMGFTSHSQVLLSILFGDKLNSDGLEFGLEGGFNWSDISGLDADKRLSTFNLGFYFDFRLKNQWNIYTGVLVKAKLGDDKLSPEDLAFLEITPNAEEEGTYSQVINYFVVPALLKYNFKNRMYVEAGPQFGLMYKSWVEFESNLDNKDIKTKDYNKDKINRLDTGITFGTGYKLMPDSGMTLGLKYYYGFTNVYKGVSGSNNSSLFLKLNLPIGAGKKNDNPKLD
jgi:opacity protein-like surface antigen